MMYFATITRDTDVMLNPDSDIEPVEWIAFVGHTTGEGMRLTFPDVDVTITQALLQMNTRPDVLEFIGGQEGGMIIWRTKPSKPVAIPTHDAPARKQ